MVRGRSQSQTAFSNESSTESQLSWKLFRAVVQLDAHDEESIKDSQNDKLQSDPSHDGHAIENEVEPIPPRSEPPLSSCSNVQTDDLKAVEILLVLLVLKLGDDPEVYIPLQVSIKEPEP